ncbi:DUF7350 domain-containing protein [Natronosalvus rutilus]|uniref:DUF7350 domain-containing protein n=1 Tax=Natronosalvus rutilus TaxID=2953753 RepID=A0A9E7NA20_9EURY|nr:hypothetical protein [Natronosalvus rutilus]UTF53616.1 hypothetical protein NGM29_17905 [Natronosalvus rutilus]
MRGTSPLTRRRLLQRATAGAGTLAIAGCLERGEDDTPESNGDAEPNGSNDTNDSDDLLAFPEIEDPPDAVYRPTHRERMRMLEPVDAGDHRVAGMVTYPHPFWLVDGSGVKKVEPDRDDVHLMVTAWDRETEQVVPVDSSPVLELSQDGEFVREVRPWLMLSQQMGFHFGDNLSLEGDGTYRVEGRLSPVSIRKTGAFADRLEERVSFEFAFDFDDDLRRLATEVEYFPKDEWGERGALEPMGHGDGGSDGADREGGDGDSDHDNSGSDHDSHAIPYSSAPPARDLPGSRQEPLESGDAVFEITTFEPGSRFVNADPEAGGDDHYLAVSPRTPYNHCVLPLMGLEATVDGDSRRLTETLDHELGLHYGTALATDPNEATLELEVQTPPQVSRHRGYETAFLEMPSASTVISL